MGQHQGVTGSHDAICIQCVRESGDNGLHAKITNFGDGSYEWQCFKNSKHHGYDRWPVGSPAYGRAVDPKRGQWG